MKENHNKYRQTINTPCLQPPLRNELGLDGNTSAGRDILNGNYQPPTNTSKYTKELLLQLKRFQIKQPFPEAKITSSLYQSGWKAMNEHISSGLSGIHFGHMKSCAMDSDLSDFESSLSNIPYTTGYTPPEWQTDTLVMIKKG